MILGFKLSVVLPETIFRAMNKLFGSQATFVSQPNNNPVLKFSVAAPD